MTQQNADNVKGIRLKSVSIIMMVITCLAFGFLIWQTFRIFANFQKLETSLEAHERMHDAAAKMREGTDYLTEQVRRFVATGNIEYLDNYFRESTITKSREQAIKEFEQAKVQAELTLEINESMNKSMELMLIEFHAMRLAAMGYGIDETKLPQEVAEAALSQNEIAMTAAEKKFRAIRLVFGSEYDDYKKRIHATLDGMIEGAAFFIQKQIMVSSGSLNSSLAYQRNIILSLLVINFAMFGIMLLLVSRPLIEYIKQIKSNNKLNPKGSYEFKYLAVTYNNIHEQNSKTANLLKYSSEHDKLSGAYNRRAFDSITQMLTESSSSLALLIIDIDYFKTINDTHGHNVGDAIIRKTAETIEKAMRTSDSVCRFGGDEFCVIALGVDEHFGATIKRKIADINKTLGSPSDDLPAVSISCGAAISLSGYSEELFLNADRALYEIKKNGRHGCVVSENIIAKCAEQENFIGRGKNINN